MSTFPILLDDLESVDDKPQNSRHWKAFSTVVGGTIYMLWVGGIYITGNLQPYVQSFFEIGTDQASILLPSIYFFQAVFVPMTGKLTQSNF
jgi:hypothetical protein